jgi:inorganic pyrophosphatase
VQLRLRAADPGGDGDPADVLVVLPLPLVPGSVIAAVRSAC